MKGEREVKITQWKDIVDTSFEMVHRGVEVIQMRLQ